MTADIIPVISLRVARICGIISACIGSLGLCGWILDSRVLTGVRMEYIPLAPNTAFIIILLGIALFFVTRWPGLRGIRLAIAGLASFCILLAGLTLAGIVTGIDLKTDALFISASGTLGSTPVGHMSPVTAACLLLGCAAILLLLKKKNDPAAILGTIITLTAGVMIIGYWYGTPLLYGGPVIPVALPTAVALGILGIGLIAAAGPASWPLSGISDGSTRAKLLRGLLPVIFIVILMANWIPVFILGTASSAVVLAAAVMAIVSLVVMYLVVSSQSREIGDTIDNTERERKRADEALQQKTTDLEAAFEEITGTEEELRANYEELATVQQALRESERKYRNLYQYAQVGLFETSFKDATVVACNQRYADLAGFDTIEEAIGSDILHLYVNPEDRTEVGRILKEQGHIENHIIRLRNRRTKKEFWGQFSARFDREREVAIGSIIDITPQKEAEKALRDSNRRLQEAQEMAHLGFWSWDVKTGEVEWSDEVFRIFGLDSRTFKTTIDSVLARSPWPEDHERDKELIRKAIASHEPGTYEQRFLRPDNSIGYYHSTFQGRYDDSGNLVSIVGTVLDTTERRRADEALRESETRFRTLVEQLPIGIAMTRRDAHGEDIFYFNRSFTAMTGYTMDIIPSFDAWVLQAYPDPEYREEMIRHAKEMYDEAGKDITSQPRVTRVTCSDGAGKDIEFRYTDLGVFGFWTLNDITGRLRAEEQRETLIRELERKNTELERFTYTISHDLKSPLITIRGFTGLLEKDSQSGNPDALKHDIQRINTAAGTMQALLSDVLELSRVGRVINPPSKVSFETIAKEAADLLAGSIAERGVAVEIAPGLPDVRVDHVRIREVLVNLIENAIKFTGSRPDPKIWIGVETEGPEPVFYVRDNGIGIDQRYFDRIFNLFEKLEPVIPGTGIGLPIVKRIIEVHGGRIWAESEGPGKGTTFKFTLPGPDDNPKKKT